MWLLLWIYFFVALGLAMSDRMKDDLVVSALQQAIIHCRPGEGLVHHSDRGNQYTSKDFR